MNNDGLIPEIQRLIQMAMDPSVDRVDQLRAARKLGELGYTLPGEPSPEPLPKKTSPAPSDELPRKPTADGKPPAPIYDPVMTPFSEIASKCVEWIWKNRFPEGKVAIIVGDPGLGKSQIAVSMAAIVSTGSPWPDRRGERQEPGSVLILNAEDDAADTIKPRLEHAGADMDRVINMTTVRRPDNTLAPFSIRRDIRSLDLALSRMKRPRLVIIDPIMSFLGGADEHKSGEVRDMIDPLKTLAEKHRVCILLVNHFNKGAGIKALYRMMGSISFGGAARIVWSVTPHPKKKGMQLMTFSKSNISAPIGGLAFSLDAVTGRFSWLDEPVPWTTDEVLNLLRENELRNPEDGSRGPVPIKGRLIGDMITERLKGGQEVPRRKITSRPKRSLARRGPASTRPSRS